MPPSYWKYVNEHLSLPVFVQSSNPECRTDCWLTQSSHHRIWLPAAYSYCDSLCSHTISVDNWRISRALSEQIRLSAPVRNPQLCNGRSDDPLRPAAHVFQLLVPVAVHVNWTPEFNWKQILCCQSNTTGFLHLDTAAGCGCYWPASGQLCKTC